jgi:hypothetical protein
LTGKETVCHCGVSMPYWSCLSLWSKYALLKLFVIVE